MERYHLTKEDGTPGYLFTVAELRNYDPSHINVLMELDLLTYTEPTFSRYTLGAFLRHGRVFVARADDLVIGACHCLRDYDHPEEVVIFNMALRPGWRGHGLGTRFLEKAMDILKEQGVKVAKLQVATSNRRAIFVYEEKFGFTVVGEHPNEYNNGATYLVMRRNLG